MVNELRQKSANQISDKIDAEEWFTYFRKLFTPHNSAKSGLEKLVDFNEHRGKTHWAWAQNLTSGQLFISGLVYKPIA